MSEVKTKPKSLAAEERLEAARIEALRNSSTSKRSFDDYHDFLGFDIEGLAGKRILDVGGGSAIVAIGAEKLGAEVITLDPRADPMMRPGSMLPEEMEHYEQSLSDDRLVCAAAQDLPYEDGSFDMVIAVMSVPIYLPDIESERDLVITEMARVLKPNGVARVYPVVRGGETEMSIPEATIKRLEAQGYEVTFEEVLRPFEEIKGTIDRLVVRRLQT